jgi:uncharacterized protein YqgQ
MVTCRNPSVNESAVELAIAEIKLHINQKLYQRGALTEEMYTKAKEIILREVGIGKYTVARR